MKFCKERFAEYDRLGITWPGDSPSQRSLRIRRQIAADYRRYVKNNLQPPPVTARGHFLRDADGTSAHGEGGISFVDPELKGELEPHINREPDSEPDEDTQPQEPGNKPQSEPDHNGSPPTKGSAENTQSPELTSPSPPSKLSPDDKDPPSPARTRSQATKDAIFVLTNTAEPLYRGHFSSSSWDVLFAVHGEGDHVDPKSVLQAMNGPDAKEWREAIAEELRSLQELEVYTEIKRSQVPKGKKILQSKVVFKYKTFEQRFKARLVVLGFMQSDEDAGETFAPVAKFTTFRILMAIACALNLDISSSDVKTAFLNAILTEAIYIYPPRGLGFSPDTVWKLLKNLYGLKGAPRGWNLNFHTFLLEIGFVQSIMDPCLYHIAGLWVLVWVDDTLKVGTPEQTVWFEEQLDKRYTMTHVRDTEMFVGIEITRDREARTLLLSQKAYFEKLLKNCGMIDIDGNPDYGIDTPMAENSKVTRDDCCGGDPKLIAEVQDICKKSGYEYASAAASLLYAAICTRPDLAFTCKEICKVMADPGPKHFTVLKRALKYLRGTRDLGLKYQARDIMDSLTMEYVELKATDLPDDVILRGFCDASYGDDPDTKRSTQGFIAKLCGAGVGWFSQGQKSTSLSTAEAELIALSDGIKEILFMREAMTFFGVPQLGPTVIYEDNAAVVSTAHNPGKNHGKLKHVAVRTHRVQEEIHLETIDVIQKGTHLMQADILTKALGKSQHKKLALATLGYEQLEDGL